MFWKRVIHITYSEIINIFQKLGLNSRPQFGNKKFEIFEKNDPWDLSSFCNLSSPLEWKVLITFLVDLLGVILKNAVRASRFPKVFN